MADKPNHERLRQQIRQLANTTEYNLEEMSELRDNAKMLNTSDFLHRLLKCAKNLHEHIDVRPGDVWYQVLENAISYTPLEDLNKCIAELSRPQPDTDQNVNLITSSKYMIRFWPRISDILPPSKADLPTFENRVFLGLMLNFKRTVFQLMKAMLTCPAARKPAVEVLYLLEIVRTLRHRNELVVPNLLVSVAEYIARDITKEHREYENVTDKDFGSVVGHFCFHREIVPKETVLHVFNAIDFTDAKVKGRYAKLVAEAELVAKSNVFKFNQSEGDSSGVGTVTEKQSVVQKTFERNEAANSTAAGGLTADIFDHWLGSVTDGETKETMRGFFEKLKNVKLEIVPDPRKAFAEKKVDEIQRLIVWYFGNHLSHKKLCITIKQFAAVLAKITEKLPIRNQRNFVRFLEMDTVIAAMNLMDDSDYRKPKLAEMMVTTKIRTLLTEIESSGCSKQMKRNTESVLRNLHCHLNDKQKIQILDFHKRLSRIDPLEPEEAKPQLQAQPCHLDNKLQQLYQDEAAASGFTKKTGTKWYAKEKKEVEKRNKSDFRLGLSYYDHDVYPENEEADYASEDNTASDNDDEE